MQGGLDVPLSYTGLEPWVEEAEAVTALHLDGGGEEGNSGWRMMRWKQWTSDARRRTVGTIGRGSTQRCLTVWK